MESNTSKLEVEASIVEQDNQEGLEYQIISTDKDDIFILKESSLGDFVPINVIPENKLADILIEPSDIKDQLYCCNTCNISFISITDHIKEHHNGQEVVIEMDEGENIMEKSIDNIALVNTLSGETTDSPCIDQNLFEIPPGQSLQECIIVNGESVQNNEDEAKLITISENESILLNETDPTCKFYCAIADSSLETAKKIDDKKINKPKSGSYTCFHCNLTYNNNKSYCAHMKIHKSLKTSPKKNKNDEKEALNNPSGQYECKICLTTFPSNKSLTLHKRMHDTVKTKLDAPLVQPHSDLVDDNGTGVNDFYHCSVCEKWIHVYFRLIHDRTHTEDGGLNCTRCNKRLFNEESLEMHMKVHAVEKEVSFKSAKKLLYKCNFCNRQFGRPYDKVKHERIHTGEKPYKCNVCSKSFRVSHCLTLHLRTHTGARPYECEHCGKKFKSHSVYNHHILLHSDVRGYKCTFCPKTFKTAVLLAGHKNSHIKPYNCNECNRPFSSLYSARMHMEKHRRSNNMKYKCQQCGASYARDFALKEHLREQHSIYKTDRDSEPETEITTEYILPN